MGHRHRRSIAALAAAALLLAALLPALSAGWAAVRTAQSPWLVICSVHNPLSSVASRLDALADGGADSGEVRCPLCAGPGGMAALPAQGAAGAFISGLSHTVPQRFLRTTRPLFIWAAVRSRGPPSQS
jgi:hypothetical protein